MKNWKAKTIIAGTILLLIVASVYYYIALPAINIHSPGFWKFIIVVLVAAMIIYLLFQTRFTQSAGSGYFSADRFGRIIPAPALVPRLPAPPRTPFLPDCPAVR